MADKKLGIVGVGNMGAAIVRGVVKAGLYNAEEVVFCDLVAEKAESQARELKVDAVSGASDVAKAASLVIIAVKPQGMEQCLSEMKDAITASHLVISIAAGITTDFIEARLKGDVKVVRVMPNTPALVGAGVAAVSAGANATEDDIARTREIFSSLGDAYIFDESLIDAVTAVSGSGPAYLFLFAECLERAAIKAGLPESEANGIVTQTLFGASKLLLESDEGAPKLRERVTSPGGTTEAALRTFDERGFEQSVIAAVDSALKRARELGGAKN